MPLLISLETLNTQKLLTLLNTGINQLYVDWTGIKNTKFRLGRQALNLHNVRFIGDIGFRQVMQVFDGGSVVNKSIPNTEVFLAHFERVRQITTKNRDEGALEIANVKYRLSPTEYLIGYAYLDGFDDLGLGNAWFGAGALNNAGKLSGYAVRVPTANVSMVDLTFIASRKTTKEEVNRIIKEASEGALKGILAYNTEPLVSSDFNHTEASSNFDAKHTTVIGNLVKIMAWYDNEWAFSCRMLDAATALMHAK